MLNARRRTSDNPRLIRSLFTALSAQARQPAFFRDFGVADTLDGRFDLVALHAWLVFSRLRSAGLDDVAQGLSDTIFIGFDEALKDLGAGDMGMGRKLKQMGEAFNGRMQAYGAAPDETALAEAILRNVYRGASGRQDAAFCLAGYAIQARARLAVCDPLSGPVDFGPLPQPLG